MDIKSGHSKMLLPFWKFFSHYDSRQLQQDCHGSNFFQALAQINLILPDKPVSFFFRRQALLPRRLDFEEALSSIKQFSFARSCLKSFCLGSTCIFQVFCRLLLNCYPLSSVVSSSFWKKVEELNT